MKKYLVLFLLLLTGSCYASGIPTTNHRYVNGQTVNPTTVNANFENRDTCLTTSKDYKIKTLSTKHLYSSKSETLTIIPEVSGASVNLIAIPYGYSRLISVSINNISRTETINILGRPFSSVTSNLISQNVSSTTPTTFNIVLNAGIQHYVEISNSGNYNNFQLTLLKVNILQGVHPKSKIMGGTGGASAFTKDTVANLKVWFKADAGVTGTSAISAWANQADGGAGYDLAQGVAGRQPSLNTSDSDFNYNATIQFDGGDCLFKNSPAELTGPFTIYIVYKRTGTTGGPEELFRLYDSHNEYLGWQVIVAGDTVADNGAQSTLTDHFNTTKYIYRYISNGADSTARFNSEGTQPLCNTTGAIRNLYFGAYDDVLGPTICKIAEILLYQTGISTIDDTTVMSYLNNKYSVY
jgi:hypothetical protein